MTPEALGMVFAPTLIHRRRSQLAAKAKQDGLAAGRLLTLATPEVDSGADSSSLATVPESSQPASNAAPATPRSLAQEQSYPKLSWSAADAKSPDAPVELLLCAELEGEELVKALAERRARARQRRKERVAASQWPHPEHVRQQVCTALALYFSSLTRYAARI